MTSTKFNLPVSCLPPVFEPALYFCAQHLHAAHAALQLDPAFYLRQGEAAPALFTLLHAAPQACFQFPPCGNCLHLQKHSGDDELAKNIGAGEAIKSFIVFLIQNKALAAPATHKSVVMQQKHGVCCTQMIDGIYVCCYCSFAETLHLHYAISVAGVPLMWCTDIYIPVYNKQNVYSLHSIYTQQTSRGYAASP